MTEPRSKEILTEEIRSLKGRLAEHERLYEKRARTDRILQSFIELTSKVTGLEFLQALVKYLAAELRFSYALIGEVTGEKRDNIQTLAVWAKDSFAENFVYELAGTPCEKVVGKTLCYFPKDVQKRFPEDRLLVDMGVESYIGVPIFDSTGSPLGILAALDDKPVDEPSDARLILSVFATRAGVELKRKKAEDEMRKVHNMLEFRVQERTSELSKANEALRDQILERHRAEEALRESEELYRTLAESADDFIYIIGRDMEVKYINGCAAGFLGLSKEEIVGSHIKDIFPAKFSGFMIPNLEAVFRSGRPFFCDEDFSMVGSQVWLGTRLNPIFGPDGSVKAVLGISRDITERTKWAAEIQKERDMAQKYLDVAGVMIVIIDSSQKVTLINRRGCDILGYGEKEIIGKNWFDNFVPERLRPKIKEVFSKVMNGSIETVRTHQNPVVTRNGEERMIEWKNAFLEDDSGNVIAALSSGEDITERKMYEDERERLIVELKDALSNIKTLKGLLPICASCKKIRDDNGYWRRIEVYIQEHSEADFSHGICPDCAKKIDL